MSNGGSQGGASGGIGVALIVIFGGHWLLGKVTDWSFGTKALVVSLVGGFMLFALAAGSKKS